MVKILLHGNDDSACFLTPIDALRYTYKTPVMQTAHLIHTSLVRNVTIRIGRAQNKRQHNFRGLLILILKHQIKQRFDLKRDLALI